MRSKEGAQNDRGGYEKLEKNGWGVGENTHELEKNAKMLEKINTIIKIQHLLKVNHAIQHCPRKIQRLVSFLVSQSCCHLRKTENGTIKQCTGCDVLQCTGRMDNRRVGKDIHA